MGFLEKNTKLFFNKSFLSDVFLFLTIITYPFAHLFYKFTFLKAYVLFGAFFILLSFDIRKINLKTVYPLIMFVTFSFLTLFWSQELKSSIYGIIKLLFLLMFTLSLAAYLENREKYIILGYAAASVNILVFIFVLINLFFKEGCDKFLYMYKHGLVHSGEGMFSEYIYKIFYQFPFLDSQNATVTLIVSFLGIIIFVNLFIKKINYFFVFSVIVSIISLYLGLSKSAFLAMAVLMFFLFVAIILYKNKILLLYFLIIIFTNLFIFIFNPFNFRNALINRFNIVKENKVKNIVKENKDSSISSRVILWNYAYKFWKSHFLIGNGYEGLKQKYIDLHIDEHVSHPHNIYLKILSEEGIIGFLIFLYLIGYMLFFLIKHINVQNIVLMGLLSAYLIRGIFGWQLNELDIWIIFGLIFKEMENI